MVDIWICDVPTLKEHHLCVFISDILELAIYSDWFTKRKKDVKDIAVLFARELKQAEAMIYLLNP